MKKCKYCQQEIANNAKFCPNCSKKQGNFFQQHPVLTVILAIILLPIIVGMISGGNDDTKTKKTGKVNQKEETLYSIGDVISNEKYEITITGVKTANEVGGEYLKSNPAEGGIYVCVDFTLKNISEEPINSFSLPTIKLVDSKGTKYSADISASGYYATETDPNRKILSDLNPGITVNDNDVYEVSETDYNSGEWYLLIDRKIKVKIK